MMAVKTVCDANFRRIPVILTIIVDFDYGIKMKYEFVDLGLYFKSSRTLIIGDTHLGYEENLRRSGVFVPFQQFGKTRNRLDKIFDSVDVNRIIVNGDVKDEFGSILNTEWKEVLDFVDYLKSKCSEVVFIKGNHDKILDVVLKKKELDLVDSFSFDDVFVCHGNKIFDTDKGTIVIGHEHPAVMIKSRIRAEMFKCFLVGKFNDKELVVIPSFNVLTEGSDILNGKLLSPYLSDVSNFEVYVVGKDVLHFGKVRDIKINL